MAKEVTDPMERVIAATSGIMVCKEGSAKNQVLHLNTVRGLEMQASASVF